MKQFLFWYSLVITIILSLLGGFFLWPVLAYLIWVFKDRKKDKTVEVPKIQA